MGHFGNWQYRQIKTEGFRAALSGAPLKLPTYGKNKGIQNYNKRQDITVAIVFPHHRINVWALLPQVILKVVGQIR